MATHTITGHPEYGIPEGSTIRIDSVANEKRRRKNKRGVVQNKKYKERHLVWSGEIDGEFTRTFDPGKYVYKIHKSPEGMTGGFMYYGEFLVGMSEEQFSHISQMKPNNAKAIMTSEGVRWDCRWPGCSKKSTSKISAYVHEVKVHYGADPFEQGASFKERTPLPQTGGPESPTKRGPGRPPGSKNKPKE